MTDHPVDFSSLDPRRDPDRFDGMIRHVVQQGLPRPMSGLALGLSQLFAPVFALSLALILVFGGLTAQNLREPGASATTAQTPTEFAFFEWAQSGAGAQDGGPALSGGPAVSGGLDAWQELEMLRR